MTDQTDNFYGLPCPLCGYNIGVQILHRIDRCSECGFVIPEFDPEPRDTLEQRWDEMAEAVRMRIKRGLSRESLPRPRKKIKSEPGNHNKDYLLEDLLYANAHRDGKPYYQHEADGPCDDDFAYLFTWDSFPKKGEHILELGCGDGFTTDILAGMGLTVTGIDCSPTAIKRAVENLADAEPRPTVRVGDVCDLDLLETDSFSYILDSHCLHCVSDYSHRLAFLNECRRVLRPGGRLFLAPMAAQPMDWISRFEGDSVQSQFAIDERGCYFMSYIPPRETRRVKLRLWVTEEILRDEISAAALEIVRFETFTPDHDPNDFSFLVELTK